LREEDKGWERGGGRSGGGGMPKKKSPPCSSQRGGQKVEKFEENWRPEVVCLRGVWGGGEGRVRFDCGNILEPTK